MSNDELRELAVTVNDHLDGACDYAFDASQDSWRERCDDYAIIRNAVDKVLQGSKPKPNTLTCVYCGHAYPEGTPPHGSKVLTDHIKVCEKHPMRKLRNALVGLIGVDGFKDLQQLELTIRTMPAPDADKAVTINAIHALVETLPTP